jgi:DNA-binding transcriptional regulator YdaS (Cro superfamily)
MWQKGITGSYYDQTPEQVEAVQAGKAALRDYCEAERGRAARVARRTGILPPVLSKMIHSPNYSITLETAVMLEIATEGALSVEVLCPLRADVFREILERRGAEA